MEQTTPDLILLVLKLTSVVLFILLRDRDVIGDSRTHIQNYVNTFAILSLQMFSQRIVFNVLGFLSWCHKRKADIKKRWGDIKTFGGISDPNGGWQTLLEKTPANNKCFIELLFCSYCSYIFFHPNQVQSLVSMIIIFAKDGKIHMSAISS